MVNIKLQIKFESLFVDIRDDNLGRLPIDQAVHSMRASRINKYIIHPDAHGKSGGTLTLIIIHAKRKQFLFSSKFHSLTCITRVKTRDSGVTTSPPNRTGRPSRDLNPPLAELRRNKNLEG